MKLLKNDELTDIYGGAMGVFFLADHGKSLQLPFNSVPFPVC